MEYEPLPFGRLLRGTGYIFNCRGRGVQDKHCLVATVYVGFYHCNQEGFSVRSQCSSQLLWWFQRPARRDTVHRRNPETCRTLNPIKTEIFSISTGAYHDRKSTSACQPSHKIQARSNSVNYHTKSYKRIQQVAEKKQQLRTFQLQNGGMSWKSLQGPCCCSIVDDQSTNGVQVRVSGTLDLFFSAVKMGGFSYPGGLKGLNLEHRWKRFPL